MGWASSVCPSSASSLFSSMTIIVSSSAAGEGAIVGSGSSVASATKLSESVDCAVSVRMRRTVYAIATPMIAMASTHRIGISTDVRFLRRLAGAADS